MPLHAPYACFDAAASAQPATKCVLKVTWGQLVSLCSVRVNTATLEEHNLECKA